ncbi:hypothetical protein QR680_002303 [Steinernema hermaphroditum]|uniref:NR LBD domain-containing protein n=1 Tax=Steinernema hermaphroditum TaxID=289476 RepID=A0AA39LHW8_9BILA|nr:hypothetical protein QR680_002303 [Steinernema hermaphroditum]
MNPNQLAFAFDGTPGDSTLREMWNSKSMVNIAEASRLFRNLRFSKLQKCNPNIQSGASTSDSSYSFEMYKEMVWEERDSAHLFISKLKLFEGLSPEDQAILHAEFMKAWLPYMFGVWTAMNNGAAISRCYTSPNTYFELNVDVLRSLLITNFSDVKPYVPFDFDSMGKQFYAIICHHLRQIAPLFRVEDSDVDLAIQLIFILLNSGRDLSGEGRSVIQNAANQLFRELHKYCNMRKVDFAEKTGDLLSLYHKISEGTRLFNEILCTMQVHCGPDHFFYLMPKRIRKMWACPMKTASLPSSPDLDSH